MGGFYQWSLSILEALVELNEDYEIILFSDDPSILEQHEHIKENIRIVQFQKEKTSFIKNSFRIFFTLWGRGMFTDVLKGGYSALDQEECEVIFHPYWGAAAFLTSTPAICTIADSAPRDQPMLMPILARWKLDLSIRAIIKKSKLILVESEWGGHLLQIHYNANPSKIRVLPLTPPNYLAAEYSAKSEREVLAKMGIHGEYIFLPGRWDGYKNTKRVLKALCLLREAGMNPPCLVLSGLKALEIEPAEREIKRLKLEDYVIVVGYVPDVLMPCLYRNAIALVFPTLLGPTSLPVIEAISLGCPVIVPNIPAYPEQAGDAGITVDPYSVESIAEGIKCMVFQEELRESLKRNALIRAEKLRELNYGERLRSFISEVTAAT